jgi:hypothetical protein
MPLASRLLFTLSAIGVTLGAHVADLSPSHMFNDRWPAHAKFHTGQTLSMSVVLALLTILFAWRRTSDRRGAVYATAGFAAAYWVTQAGAIAYPNTAFYDPEFTPAHAFTLGLPIQAYFEILFISLIALASWLALRKAAHWSDSTAVEPVGGSRWNAGVAR